MSFGSTAYNEDKTFAQIDAPNGRFNNLTFDQCHFDGAVFSESAFIDCTFEACTFEGCDFSLATFEGCRFVNGRFATCKLIGINWTVIKQTTFIKDAPFHFHNCILDFSTFIGTVLHKLSLKKCSLREVDFSEADLSQANFSGANLNKAIFRHTNLSKADFRNATSYDIDITQNNVTKAQFSIPEAIALLQRLDIKLEL